MLLLEEDDEEEEEEEEGQEGRGRGRGGGSARVGDPGFESEDVEVVDKALEDKL